MRPARINSREPQPSLGPLEPPCELSEEAEAIWRRLAPDLGRAGVLTPWDLDQFVRCCEAIVDARRARKMLEAGLLVRGRRDGMVANPTWRIYREADAQQRAWAQEFGLTPSARSRLEVATEPVSPDQEEELLG